MGRNGRTCIIAGQIAPFKLPWFFFVNDLEELLQRVERGCFQIRVNVGVSKEFEGSGGWLLWNWGRIPWIRPFADSCSLRPLHILGHTISPQSFWHVFFNTLFQRGYFRENNDENRICRIQLYHVYYKNGNSQKVPLYPGVSFEKVFAPF